ncbi:EAL domain-containing protein [Vibrio sp. TRT 21S02]|uniref:EAL domain-containing protein n=1 Tax=Vibrio sp. TRT 21S02 TaxID=3418507 RepID=UPI003CF9D427
MKRLMEQPLSEQEFHALPHVDWQWCLDEHRLEIDRELCSRVLASPMPSMTENFLLSCLNFDDQSELIKQFESAHVRQEPGVFSCPLYLDKGKISYVEFSYTPSVDKRITGSLYPLLSFPSNGQVFGSLFDQLFDNPHRGILLADSNKRIMLSNHYFQTHSGYRNIDLVGNSLSMLNSGKHSKEFYQKIWLDIDESGFWSGVILIKAADGRIIPQEMTLQRLHLRDRVFFIGYFLDLSNHLYRVQDVEHGGVELLTQLPTEQQFTQSVATRWMDGQEENVCLVVAFIPKFSGDDEFEMKSLLSEHLARNRVATQVGYIGGNHFVAFLECEKCQGPSQVRIIHQTIRRFFSGLNQSAGKAIHRAILNGKVGVSVLGHDTHSPKLLVSHAVQAMLEQTAESKGLITFYHGAIHKEVLRRKELEEWTVKCIKSGNVEVFYQPIVDVHNWDIVKFEALSRFKTPNGNMLNTQEIITIAEDLDLIADLDWCVGKKALQDLEVIQQRFGAGLGLTINRSLNTKLEPGEVLKSAELMIREHAKTPHLVTIELTESAYFDSESRQSSLISNLREQGVSVAIDDFGTGYSSFTYLSDCNFDLLKIDREFVIDLKVGSHKYYIVKMIIELAHTLEVKVVAEGVETRYELEVLCSLGVDYIQGYFFSKPLALDELEHAWEYFDKLEDFLERRSSVRGVGILSITHTHIPCLEPQDTLEKAKGLFDSNNFNIELLPILDGNTCVGLIDRESLNFHLSPTLGTKLETTKDLTIWQKRLNQVMRTDLYRISFQTKVTEIADLLKSGVNPPWVVEDEAGNYLGTVTKRDVFEYFANG